MNQNNDGPNEYEFGHDFNYAAWTMDTVVTLCNVPWNNDYRDIVRFANRTALNKYIDAKENSSDFTRIENVSYLKVNQPVRLDIPFNRAIRHNYLRASNKVQPIPGGDSSRDFYYFITDVRYISPNTTEFVLQLDVWQTFGYDVKFGNSYVERGHIGIANENAFNNYGRDYLNVPEGLDVGSEYRVVSTVWEPIMQPPNNYDVLVVSTVDLTADPGTVASPNLVTAKGSVFQGIPQGAQLYIFSSAARFMTFMQQFASKPWVTQGIVSITVIPSITRYHPGFTYADDEYIGAPAPQDVPQRVIHKMRDNWRDTFHDAHLPTRYRHLKKFLTFPYTVIELTTWTGTPIILKPESWNDPDATVHEHAMLVPPQQRVTFVPRSYNANDRASDGAGDDQGNYFDTATMIANFPTLSIVNNGAIMYMAQNAHGIAFQNQNADWSQQRALRGNEVSYDQAGAGINATGAQGRISRMLDVAQTSQSNMNNIVNSLTGGLGSIASGAGGGAMAGGAPGAAAGATIAGGSSGLGTFGMIQNVLGMTQANTALGNRLGASRESQDVSTGTASYMRDTNKSLADWAARGDYENTIAGINARVQDAQLTPPTTVGQVGGELFNLLYDASGLSIRWKLADDAAIRVIGEYWLRYGYAVRHFMKIPDSFQVMTKFTYWKLAETYVTGAPMPESFKQIVRGIFEKGVTVWANPADIGTIDIADNKPLPGVAY